MEETEVAKDHYRVLDLRSGEEGSKHIEKQITKSYRENSAKALQLHLEKRLKDPNTKAMFQKLSLSYALLMNAEDRKRFHSFLKGEEKKKKEACENVLYAFGHLTFTVGPMFFPAFPGARTTLGYLIRGFCFEVAFDFLSSRKKLEKLCSMMIRVGDYLKRNRPQAAINQEPELITDHPKDSYVESIYRVLALFRSDFFKKVVKLITEYRDFEILMGPDAGQATVAAAQLEDVEVAPGEDLEPKKLAPNSNKLLCLSELFSKANSRNQSQVEEGAVMVEEQIRDWSCEGVQFQF